MSIHDVVESLTPDQRRALLWFRDSINTFPNTSVWMAWSPRDDPGAPSVETMNSLLMMKRPLVIADSGQVLHRLSAYGKRVRKLIK